MITLADVEAAATRIAGGVARTPFLHSRTLSRLTRSRVWLKFENLQFTGSFKERGALNKLLTLTPEEQSRGVITVSAGNHAQGLAYHAAALGVPATIVMPVTTPAVKANRTREFGAQVILRGQNFAEASAALAQLVAERDLVLVHPYEDLAVMAGQGTVALEMLEVQPELDSVVIAVGGGGLIAGMATVLRARLPEIEIIGAQSERYPGMAKALGSWSGDIPGGVSVAEGIAVAEPGQMTRAHAAALVDDIVVVPEAAIEESMALLVQIEKTLCEGAGAVGLATLLTAPERFRDRRVGLVLCGGNIDNRLLATVLQRQLARHGQLLRLAVTLPDQAGSLGRVCTVIGEFGGNINSVTHDRTFLARDARSARVMLELELVDPAAAARLIEQLESLGLRPERLAALEVDS